MHSISTHAHRKNRMGTVLAKSHEAQLRKCLLTPTGLLAAEVCQILGRIRNIQSASVDRDQTQVTVKRARLTGLCYWQRTLLPDGAQWSRSQSTPSL
jgi:hypothetical protein